MSAARMTRNDKRKDDTRNYTRGPSYNRLDVQSPSDVNAVCGKRIIPQAKPDDRLHRHWQHVLCKSWDSKQRLDK